MSFEVATYADLKKVGTGVDGWDLDADYIQTADIDASASATENPDGSGGYYGFEPIGDSYSNRFQGTYDGQGYTISNLYIHRPSTYYVGLFGVVYTGGVISNIALTNCDISGNDYVGGFCGYSYGTTTNCYSTGSVSGNNFVGGFCGISYVTITNCYSTGSVSGDFAVGGFCGYSYGTTTNCYSTGSVGGDDFVGGFCGFNDGTITNCYWNTETSGQATSDGGTGLTTAQMTYPYDASAYSDWDFTNIWYPDGLGDNGGYPMLLAFIDDYIQTNAASAIAYTAAKLNAKITVTGSDYIAYFQYRIKGTGSWTATDDLTIDNSQNINVVITGLDQNKTYEFRGVLEESDVVISYGMVLEFTTLTNTATGEVVAIATPTKLTTTKEINGAWTADVELTHESVDCEQYIDIEGESYIAKKVIDLKDRNGTFTHINAWHIGMAELGDTTIDRFSRKDTVSNFLDLILDGSNWSAGTCDINETIYLHTDKRVSRLEALNRLAEVSGGEIYFNSTDRTVDLKREVGTFTGLFISYKKNSDYILREMDSTNLVTRTYPYGSDNLAINQTTISYCEEPTDWSPSGGGSATASNDKMFGSQATLLTSSTLNETFINDLGAGGVIDLSGHDTVKFWIYSATDNANGFTFGIGKSAYTELTVNTGALEAECWHEIELDLSAVADASKNAIRYIGFKNLTDGAAEVIIDGIRGFYSNQYIDSPNISKYKINKEFVYRHSAKPEKQYFSKRIYPSDDTYAAQAYPNLTCGARTYFKVRDRSGYSDDYQSFIKFDLSELPTGATIEGADLKLYFYRAENVGKDTAIKLVTADWNEDTLTWNNKPAYGAGTLATLQTQVADGYGWKEASLTSTVSDWYDGTTANYGLALIASSADAAQQTVEFWSKESGEYRPYIEVTYSMLTDPNDVIIAGATDYLYQNHEPAIRYEVNLADLSEVMVNTWESETIGLGDTVKVYDKDLGLNVYVRVKKITRNILEPTDVKIELANRAYTIADLEAKRARQLSYAMPCQDNPNIIDASAIQIGYLGSDVQV